MIGQRSWARPIFLLSYLLPLLCVIPTLWEKFCCCSGSLQSMEMNIPVSTPAPQLLFLLSCPKPKAIFYPNQSGTRGPHTRRLLSVVRSWHSLLSRHQPHTSMEVWSSKASSRAPERLWQDLSIFQVTDWSSVEAKKIGGTPVRSRTMLAGHQEGLQANTNSSLTCSAQGFLRTGAISEAEWCAIVGGKREELDTVMGSPQLPVETL